MLCQGGVAPVSSGTGRFMYILVVKDRIGTGASRTKGGSAGRRQTEVEIYVVCATGCCATSSYVTGRCATGYYITSSCVTGCCTTNGCATGCCVTSSYVTGRCATGYYITSSCVTGCCATSSYVTGRCATGYYITSSCRAALEQRKRLHCQDGDN